MMPSMPAIPRIPAHLRGPALVVVAGAVAFAVAAFAATAGAQVDGAPVPGASAGTGFEAIGVGTGAGALVGGGTVVAALKWAVGAVEARLKGIEDRLTGIERTQGEHATAIAVAAERDRGTMGVLSTIKTFLEGR